MKSLATLPSWKALRDRLLLQEDLNFLLTNRLPRTAVTRFMGRFSKIRQPLVRDASIWVWRLCTDLDLSEAKHTQFSSLHDCFTRELRPGARPIDQRARMLCSPSDGIVGACGQVQQGQLFQAKGFPYRIEDLFGSSESAAPWLNGCYVTLRLTSAMYHRFHAPHDGFIEHLRYLSGDTWNVNPIALKRVERLFCRNERAVIRMRLAGGAQVAMVPVAAILVASIRLHFAQVLLHLKYRGPVDVPCDATVAKGDELGWFEHGSTIIVFGPPGFTLAEGISTGARVRVGQALMQLPRP